MTKECSEEDCSAPHYGRGWCRKHYNQAWRTGSLVSQPRTLVAPEASLEDRLRHTGWDVTSRGCWEWRGSTNPHGYGQMAVGNYSGGTSFPALAHRVAFTVWKSDPTGFFVCHTCDNRLCMNPDHLFLGAALDNNRDMSRKKRNPTGDYRSDVRVSEADVAQIRTRYAAGGVSQSALAQEFRISQQLVSMLVNSLRRSIPSRPSKA